MIPTDIANKPMSATVPVRAAPTGLLLRKRWQRTKRGKRKKTREPPYSSKTVFQEGWVGNGGNDGNGGNGGGGGGEGAECIVCVAERRGFRLRMGHGSLAIKC